MLYNDGQEEVMETRVCSDCKKHLPLDKFSKGKYRCKECRNKKRREAKQKFEPQFNKIKKCRVCKVDKKGLEFSVSKENKDGLRSICKECHCFVGKKAVFGIGRKEYFKMLKEQDNKCKICNSTDHKNKNNTKFHIDHCHETGKIRGLLCDACNRALGFLQDDVERINKAAEYVAKEGEI